MKTLGLAVVFLAGAAAAETFTVAPRPHGQVRFKVEGPIDDVVGETRSVTGSLEFDPAKWAELKGVCAVELASLKTGIDQRDQDMRDEFLQTARFPYAVLQIEKVDRVSVSAIAPGQTVEGDAMGTFEVHGVRRAVRVPVKLRMEADRKLWITGTIEAAFADYNITRPSRLFLKLGDVAEVSFEVLFVPKPAVAAPAPVASEVPALKPPEAPTVTTVLPMAPKPKAKPVRKPKPELKITWLFSGDDGKAKGERLFHSADLGGVGNKLTCYHCHAKADERAGLKQADGLSRAGSSVFNAAQRPKFWNGFAANVGKAASICQKMFMRGTGLSTQQEAEMATFIEAISADPAVELDYRVAWRTFESPIRDPIGGDPVRGKALADQFCMTCHLDGRVGPVWQPGLYEPEWVVRRVRKLEGHQNKHMPSFSMARLPDSDLRDIVTFLTSPKAAPPIFDRKKK